MLPLEQPLRDDTRSAFAREGWCVANLLDSDLLSQCVAEAGALLQEGKQAGFPFNRTSAGSLNELSLSSALLCSGAQLLDSGGAAVRLAESLLVHPAVASDPSSLLDYHLAVPHPHSPEAVVATVYLSAGPATILATKTELAAGAVLFSKLESRRAPTSALTVQVVLRAPHAEWVSADDFIRSGPANLADTLTPLQLCALGWPAPGHAHWNATSFAEAKRRYPKHDLGAFDPGPVSADTTAPMLPPEMPAPPQTDGLGIVWQEPELAAGTGGLTLSAEQVMRFREEGCLLLDGVWPDDLVAAACEAASSIHPLNKEESRVFTDYPTAEGPVLQRQPMFDACNNFPFDSPALNAVSLHPRILGAVAQVLEKPVHQVRVTQAALNGKYGPETPRADGVQFEFSWNNRDGNQPMHQDYGNNTMLTPARSVSHWGPLEEVQCIIYYDDWEVGGPTAFLPGLQHTGEGPGRSVSDEDRQAMYDNERCAKYRKGTVLMYQLGCWHRGTPVNYGYVRRKHHLSFRTSEATWVGGSVGVGAPTAKSLNALARGASPAVGGFNTGRFLGQLTPDQRCVIGFPAVGDPYWCEETLAGVLERYHGAVDVRPYADAAGLPAPPHAATSTSPRL